MKTYLVTGGAGFIGSNFILYMMDKYQDITIINIDDLTYAGNLDNLKKVENKKNYHFVKGNIADKEIVEKIFEDFEIDYVVNFAAESHVDRSIEDPEIFVKTNVLGTINLLKISKQNWLNEDDSFIKGKKFIHISTDEVYGSLGTDGFFSESTPLDPHSPYSASKASSDLIVKSYFDTYGFPINITRCSNNYGPFQFPEKMIPVIISNCLDFKEVPLYGDGLNIRDWLYVEDHCVAIDLVIHKGSLGEVYNIGGNNEKTNIDLVKTVIKLLQEKVDLKIDESLIKYVQDRKGHDRRYAIDASKIKRDLGWEPSTQWEKGIEKTVNWYLNNKEWLANILNGNYRNI
ncbi:dTDP-glucose 4,6-dehydratase [Bacillus halotolerans]|uniref:dTDP-glucose 4,6-dehydratase n=1 Tax=Bacillus halotolerans TaxID=260554 RepID=UPI002DBC1B37|nr:dTDP-glucose 4,6-dehydratase [Bacillus halotolerans]MEC1544806.1 dTDP-glucose 4,6-dehydratase [Bacillus halotolerans]